CLKAGPGIARSELPAGVAAVWVSERGDLVEAGLWAGAGWPAGSRTAVLLPTGAELAVDETVVPRLGPPTGYLYEPDPAVIRAGGTGQVAEAVDGWALAPGIAYLAAAELVATPLATAFAIEEVLAWDERALRAWVRRERIGVLEIKLRGVDADPAVLRRRLKPSGPNAATLVLTPTVDGARALVVRRVVS
ncbi:MAG: SAM-dependent methyltransferase, partial [Propionicimonas sp.]|nr:SAM-dependent methyltransferase [Propionicimonas sp.]